MILQASNGCLLTQSGDVSIKERRFEKTMLVASIEEAARWKEIPESEKDKIIAQGNLFEPDRVDYEYLSRVNRLMSSISEKINDGGLSEVEALEMRKYYPLWENCMGKEVFAGFRLQRENYLFEVISPHVISAETDPLMQTSTLPADGSDTVGYYKLITNNIELYNIKK